jgi:hypothetical protein
MGEGIRNGNASVGELFIVEPPNERMHPIEPPQAFLDCGCIQIQYVRHNPRIELAALHRCGCEQRHFVFTQVADTSLDHAANGIRQVTLQRIERIS